MKAFFDTNVLVYALSNDPKQSLAEKSLSEGGYVSVQVLNELVHVLLRKQKQPWAVIDDALAVVLNAVEPPVALTLSLHRDAYEIAKASRIGIYDALIIAAALKAGCDILYSEDLNHGQRFAGVTITNPFLGEFPAA